MVRSRKQMPRRKTTKTRPYKPTRGQFKGRTFKNKRAYRAASRRASTRIRTLADLNKLSPTAQQNRSDSLEVLNLMRSKKLGLTSAVKQFKAQHPDTRIGEQTVRKFIQPALRKKGRGYIAKPRDSLLRGMRFPTSPGLIDLDVRSSRTASRIGEYWNAVKKYLATGDEQALEAFRGKWVRVGNKGYRFITDAETLQTLAEAGELYFDSIYEQPS